ncbi:FkbM family methyltransferase [Xanthobacteraceae bacterium A53D]
MDGLVQRIARQVADSVVRLYPRSYFDSLTVRLDSIERKLDLLEYFSHGGTASYVGNNRVLARCVVRNAIIAFFLEADDRLLSPWFIVSGRYEESLTNYFVDNVKVDSHSIDVGTNFGYFTCLLCRFSPNGKVIGIEAEENVHAIARDNVYINGFERIARVIHAAASSTNAPVTLHSRGTRSANTSIAKLSETYIQAMAEPESRAFTVPGVRVDDLLKEMKGRVDFLKVDVEGAEPLVFEGARETFAANPQLRAVMEWSPGQISTAGFDLPKFLSDLNGMGLSFYDIEPAGLKQLTADELLNIPYRAGVVLTRSA